MSVLKADGTWEFAYPIYPKTPGAAEDNWRDSGIGFVPCPECRDVTVANVTYALFAVAERLEHLALLMAHKDKN